MIEALKQPDRRLSLCCGGDNYAVAVATAAGRWFIRCSCCGGQGGGFKTKEAAWSAYATRCALRPRVKAPHLRLVKGGRR